MRVRTRWASGIATSLLLSLPIFQGALGHGSLPQSYLDSMSYLLERGPVAQRVYNSCIVNFQPRERGELPVYSLVVGVEGAGHHMIHNMLKAREPKPPFPLFPSFLESKN